MSNRDLVRLVVLGFFIGLNIILGAYFLMTVVGTGRLPTSMSRLLESFADSVGIELEQPLGFIPSKPASYLVRVDLESSAVIDSVNQHRLEAEQPEVQESAKLSAVAALVAEYLEEDEFSARDEEELDAQLGEALDQENYVYSTVLQSAVSGPVTVGELEQHWLENNVVELITSEDVSDIGVSVKVVEQDGKFTGVTVLLLAEPRVQQAAQPSSTDSASMPAVPFISDQEVFTALNQYRSDHGVHQLVENQLLCQYAEKRVQDLVAFGGLDNHQGFQADFANLDSLPDPIKQYSGGRVGENLAHQFCRNMTTGDSFIAETGTALIEWCFDSSTKGHREAQLDTAFNSVCIRHGEAMYVVIFGE